MPVRYFPVAVFPQRYGFVREGGNQTTLVAAASPERVGVYQIRDNARVAQPLLDADLLGLAARYYMRRDWELTAEVLRDDFKPAELEAAATRHNQTCVKNCRYGL
jgi:spermidine synthase